MATPFDIFVPNVPLDSKYSVTGADCQVLSVALKPGESVQSEPGAMMMMSPQVKTSAGCGACTRLLTGETCCIVSYTNEGNADGFVSLTPNFPAKVVPVHLPNVKGKFIAKKGAYMSGLGDHTIAADCDFNPITCCCGGLGFIRQGAEGSGTVFYTAGGTVLQKELVAGERVIVDATSIVGFQESVQFGLKFAGGCGGLCCGGEGCFYATLTGPGLIMVQSMPFEKFVAAVRPPAQSAGGADGQEGAHGASAGSS